jgi:hypothetical protein
MGIKSSSPRGVSKWLLFGIPPSTKERAGGRFTDLRHMSCEYRTFIVSLNLFLLIPATVNPMPATSSTWIASYQLYATNPCDFLCKLYSEKTECLQR